MQELGSEQGPAKAAIRSIRQARAATCQAIAALFPGHNKSPMAKAAFDKLQQAKVALYESESAAKGMLRHGVSSTNTNFQDWSSESKIDKKLSQSNGGYGQGAHRRAHSVPASKHPQRPMALRRTKSMASRAKEASSPGLLTPCNSGFGKSILPQIEGKNPMVDRALQQRSLAINFKWSAAHIPSAQSSIQKTLYKVSEGNKFGPTNHKGIFGSRSSKTNSFGTSKAFNSLVCHLKRKQN